jgi:hypothetical protein
MRQYPPRVQVLLRVFVGAILSRGFLEQLDHEQYESCVHATHAKGKCDVPRRWLLQEPQLILCDIQPCSIPEEDGPFALDIHILSAECYVCPFMAYAHCEHNVVGLCYGAMNASSQMTAAAEVLLPIAGLTVIQLIKSIGELWGTICPTSGTGACDGQSRIWVL